MTKIQRVKVSKLPEFNDDSSQKTEYDGIEEEEKEDTQIEISIPDKFRETPKSHKPATNTKGAPEKTPKTRKQKKRRAAPVQSSPEEMPVLKKKTQSPKKKKSKKD